MLSNTEDLNSTQIDQKIKSILTQRCLSFNTKVVQQAIVQAFSDMKRLKKSNLTKGEKNSLNFKNSRKNFSFETTKDIGDPTFHHKISLEKIRKMVPIENVLWYKNLQRKQSKRLDDFNNKIIEKLPNQYYKDKKILSKNKKKQSDNVTWNLHQITNYIIRNLNYNDVTMLCVEDLNVKKMTSKENINKDLGKAKSKSMRKDILKTSFGKILSMLEYKCAKNGIHLKKVNPKYTSKTCSSCKEINKDLKLKDRWFVCPSYGIKLERDHNACINIGGNRLSA